MKRFVGSMVIAMVLAACGTDSKKSSTPSPSTSTGTSTGTSGTADLTAGKQVYTSNCTACHGSDGKTQSLVAASSSTISSCVKSGCGSMAKVSGLTTADITNVTGYIQQKLAKGQK